MHVLFLDDEISPAKYFIREIESQPGTTLHRCWNAEEALAYLQTKPNPPVDIIVSDYNMQKKDGKMNGAQFAMLLHKQNSEIPFVLVSADHWDTIEEESKLPFSSPGTKQPISAYLHKIEASQNLVPLIEKLTAPRIAPDRKNDERTFP